MTVASLIHQMVGRIPTQGLTNLLFPPRCAGCRRRDSWLCSQCHAALIRLPDERCRVCAVPLTGVHICPDCYRRPPRFEAVHCSYVFTGPLRSLVHRLKYHHAGYLARSLAELMVPSLPVMMTPHLIVPVPLFPSRERARGHNQAALLARELARLISVPINDLAASRTRDTASQVGLPSPRRRENVRGAFIADRTVAGKAVLLVDDVCTTGATLDACAHALRRAGATSVITTVLARVVPGNVTLDLASAPRMMD